uniref:Coiled-coil domain-containing protein 112 n=1 Tax=Lymnaea stagnalis TaxID=6523 RepID=A0A7S7B105_LYMST|nr:hypothetical protein [Lymnaea stagnalis]
MASAYSTQDMEEQGSGLRKKIDQSKKADILRDIHKLNVQIQGLEREKLTHIFCKRSEFRQEFSSLEEEESKMVDERKTELIKVKQQLQKISHMVKRFHRELRDVKPTPEFVEKLKLIMEEIEGTINSFKEQQRLKYDELMRSERSLFQELQQQETKFDSWNQLPKTDLKKQGAVSARSLASDMDVTKDLPPEVAAFDKFVHQTGGHRGGWDEYDHQTFLRYRNMYKGRIVFLDHVKPLLPIRTEAEIREHETWFQEFNFLKENKKYAIKKWREKKEEEKEDAITQVQDELEEMKEEEARRKAQQAALTLDKMDRCKQLNAWKVQKELEKAMKEEKNMKEEMEKKRKQEEERKKQLEAKKLVEEFRQQKQLEEDLLHMIEEERKQHEAEQKKAVIAKELGRFRNRDMQRLLQKQEKEKEKEELLREKQRKLESLKTQVSYSGKLFR